MKNHKFTALAAALALSTMLGSPVLAALSQETIASAESLAAAGDVAGLRALIAAYPDLLALPGPLGVAIQSFNVNPTAASLATIAASPQISVGITTAAPTGPAVATAADNRNTRAGDRGGNGGNGGGPISIY